MKEINQDNLINMAVPTANMGVHQAQLKQALFAVANADNKTSESKWRTIMSKNKLILSGATIAILLIVGVSASLLGAKGSTTYAEQIAEQGSSTVSALPPSQQQAVNTRIGGNAEAMLQVAEQAKDLTVLTYTQLLQSGSNPLPPSSVGSADFASFKYLRYTDANGGVHIIGVNAQDVPVFVSVGVNKSAAGLGVSGTIKGVATMCSSSASNGGTVTCSQSPLP